MTPTDIADLVRVLGCLIDTAERTTDMENVYNGNNGAYVSWSEVYRIRNKALDSMAKPPTTKEEAKP